MADFSLEAAAAGGHHLTGGQGGLPLAPLGTTGIEHTFEAQREDLKEEKAEREGQARSRRAASRGWQQHVPSRGRLSAEQAAIARRDVTAPGADAWAARASYPSARAVLAPSGKLEQDEVVEDADVSTSLSISASDSPQLNAHIDTAAAYAPRTLAP